ncbi:MAG: caspase family protein [Pirellulales bacterium]
MALHTLHIGINYQGTPYELYGCINDARRWARLTKPFAASQILLTEKQATREGIERAIAKLKSRLEAGDEWFASNSSHGTRERDTSGDERSGFDQAIVCYGEDLYFDDEFAGIVDGLPPRVSGTAFFDSCHSGSPTRSFQQLRRRSIPIELCRRHERIRGPRTIRALAGVRTISGCQDGPNDVCYDAYFKGRPGGAATEFACRALGDLKPGASYRRWFTRFSDYLPNEEFDQTPTMTGSEHLRSRRIAFL